MPPCRAHSGSLLPGPAESALPLGREGQRERFRPPAASLSGPPHRPLQLSLPSTAAPGSYGLESWAPQIFYFSNRAQETTRITGSYIHQHKSQSSLRSPEEWGSPGSPRVNRPAVQGVWKGPCLMAAPHPLTGLGSRNSSTGPLHTHPQPPATSSHKSPKQTTLPWAITHHHFTRDWPEPGIADTLVHPISCPAGAPIQARVGFTGGSDTWEAGKRGAGLRKLLPPKLPLAPPTPLPPQTRPHPPHRSPAVSSTVPTWLG